jgi:CRISPR system Cascade subunit CasD
MTSFLLFTLYAPLSSWGEITVGEDRGSWDRPSRSAVLGLLAAALGIIRDDQSAHDELDRTYGFGVRLDAGGAVLFDYHTVQSAAEIDIRRTFGQRRPVSRKQVLSVAEHHTVVSRRELRQEALSTAVIWSLRADPRWPLAAIKGALERPQFVLYAGRKANPLALPLAPQLVDATTLAEAFAARPPDPPGVDLAVLKQRGGDWGKEVAYDPLPPGIVSGLRMLRRESRRDAQAQRARWQFSERPVTIGILPDELAP